MFLAAGWETSTSRGTSTTKKKRQSSSRKKNRVLRPSEFDKKHHLNTRLSLHKDLSQTGHGRAFRSFFFSNLQDAKKPPMFQHIWVFPKIMVPPNHPLKNRVFHYFHHPFWGVKSLYFWFNIHMWWWQRIVEKSLSQNSIAIVCHHNATHRIQPQQVWGPWTAPDINGEVPSIWSLLR